MLTEPRLFLIVIPGLVKDVRGMYSVLAAETDKGKKSSKEKKISDSDPKARIHV